VRRMHPEKVRSPRRNVANLEFHRTGHEVDEIAARIALELDGLGHRAMNPPMAFPMDMGSFPGRSWIVSHKRVAQAAQLGAMGLHRNLIHPRFGSFVLLGTVLTSAEVPQAPAPLGYNPCIDCQLCAVACPVGAIEPGGGFRFSACYDHNYREFMSGFADFVEEVVESRDRHDFRERVPLHEAVTTWQGLAYKPSYKAAYCLAVCPAGDDVLGGFVHDPPATCNGCSSRSPSGRKRSMWWPARTPRPTCAAASPTSGCSGSAPACGSPVRGSSSAPCP